MSEQIKIVNLDGSHTAFDKAILDDPTHMFHHMCKQIYEKAQQTKYPIDFNTFTILTDQEVEASLIPLQDMDTGEFHDCIRWISNQKESYNQGDQIQNIILDRQNPSVELCGCLGPNHSQGYILCPCAQVRALYEYRYNLYQYFKDLSYEVGIQ